MEISSLQSAVNFVTAMVPTKGCPVVTFTHNGVVCFGGEIMAEAELDHGLVEKTQPPFHVPREQLLSITDNLPVGESDSLKVELREPDGVDHIQKLVVSCDSVLSEIPTTDGVTLPLPKGKSKTDLNATSFGEALKHVLPTVATDVRQPEFTCVCFRGSKLHSCDRFQASEYSLEQNIFPEKGLLVPGYLLNTVSKHTYESVSHTASWMILDASSQKRVFVRLYDGKYPEIKEFFVAMGTVIEFPQSLTKDLGKALKSFTKKEQAADIVVSANSVGVRLGDSNGWLRREFDTDYNGEEVNFRVHTDHLKAIMNAGNELEVSGKRVVVTMDRAVRSICVA